MPLATPACAALLVLTPLAATAQGLPGGPAAPADWRADASPRFEAGASTSLIAIFPGFGGLVTMPTGKRLSLEVGVETLPWMIEDADDTRLLTQVQVRIPWATRPGGRRSFIVGVTAATVGDKRGSTGEWEFQSNYFPHGGVSWQWQKSPRFDLRLDVTAMVSVVPMPVPVPRVQFTTVWHSKRGVR